MEEFLKETRQRFVERELFKISDELLGADVIGVGEDLHGEDCSWKWRYAVIDHLLKNGFDVTVFCETYDGNLQNSKGMRLQELDGNANLFDVWQNDEGEHKQFYPYIIPFSNRTQWHFDMTRAFSAFPEKRVAFVGVDSKYSKYWDSDIANSYEFDDTRPEAEYATDDGRTLYNQVGNRARNYFNGKIIVDFVLSERTKQTKKKKKKFVYIAHNAHVGKTNIGYTNSVNGKREFTRSDGHVIQSGLRTHGLKYLAVGTSALKLQAFQKQNGHVQYSFKRSYIQHSFPEEFGLSTEMKTGIDNAILIKGGKKNSSRTWGCDYYFLEKQSKFPLVPITLDVTLPVG